MSDIFGALIGDAISNFALIGYTGRSIGTLIPDVVVEETHHDEATITQHPVEVGAPITDHAYMQPYTVEIRCGWSDSSMQSEGFVQEVYQQLLAMQSALQPIDIITGKRAYTGMLLRSLAVKTDETSEFALMVIALAQQVIITDTQTTAASASSSANTDGSSTVASANAPTLGDGTQSTSGGFTVSGGAAPVTTNSITPGADGTFGFSNSPYSGGQVSLQPAPSGTPTVETITGVGHQ
jgi:hypothetical protein